MCERVEGCDAAEVARGCCARHYYKLRRYGDPLAGREYGQSVTSYAGAHARVRAARGSARSMTCSCGKMAQDWAYDNEDPEELVSAEGYAYSMKVDHYTPLCRPCHKRHDIAHRIAAAAAYRLLRFGGTPCG